MYTEIISLVLGIVVGIVGVKYYKVLTIVEKFNEFLIEVVQSVKDANLTQEELDRILEKYREIKNLIKP